MSKNNRLKNATPERRNYKLYKAKKQWITACATFLLTFGATAVMNVSAQADVENNVEPTESEEIANKNEYTNRSAIDASSVALVSGTASSAGTSDQGKVQASSSVAATSQTETTSAVAKTSTTSTSAVSSVESADNQPQSASVASTSTSQSTSKAEGVTGEVTTPTNADAATKTAPADQNAKTGTASQTAETSAADQSTSSQTAESSVPATQPSVETGDKVTVKGATTPQNANPSSNVADETTLDTKSAAKATQKQAAQSLAESKDSTEDITPIPYSTVGHQGDMDMPWAVAGSDLSSVDPSIYFKNASALKAAGATFSWVGTPDTLTNAQHG